MGPGIQNQEEMNMNPTIQRADAQTGNCSVCGSELTSRAITFTQTKDGRFYVVADVPALVCLHCGEQYLSPEVVDAIGETIIHQDAATLLTVPLYHFHGATLN